MKRILFARYRLALILAALVSLCVSAAFVPMSAAATSKKSPNLSGVTIGVVGVTNETQFLALDNLQHTPYKVNTIVAPTTADFEEALDSGQAQVFTQSDDETATLISLKLPFTIIGAVQRPPSYCGVIVPKGSSITSVSQLAGKTIGDTEGTGGETVLLKALAKAHIAFPSGIQPVYFADFADGNAAFLSGKIDALASCSLSLLTLVYQDGARYVVNGDNGLWPANNYWGVTNAALKNPLQRAAVLNYIERVDKTDLYGNKHVYAESAEEALTGDTPISLEYPYNEVGPTTPIIVNPELIAGLRITYSLLADLNRIKGGVDVTKYFSTKYNSVIVPNGETKTEALKLQHK